MAETCGRCGSDRLMPEVFIVDKSVATSRSATRPIDTALQVRVPGEPQRWAFIGSLYEQLVARICGACGYTELRVRNPEVLYEQYLRHQQGQASAGPAPVAPAPPRP